MPRNSIENPEVQTASLLEGRIGRFVERVVFSRAADSIIKIGVVAASVAVVSQLLKQQESTRNTSKATIVEPANHYESINTKAATQPYYPALDGNSISMIVYCGFAPDPHSNNMIIDSGEYASVENPIINRLSKNGRSNSVSVHEVDNYVNGIDVGWSDGFYVKVASNNVKIGGAVDGGDVPPQAYKGASSPNGSFGLPPGNYATGEVGLMDYSFENVKGQFYMQVQCDPQKTEQLLAHDNNPNT